MSSLALFRRKFFIILLIVTFLVGPGSSSCDTAKAEPVTIGTALTLAATAGAISAAFSAIVYLTDCVTEDTEFDMTEFCTQTAAGFAVGFGAALALILSAALAVGGAFATGVATVFGVAAGSIASDPIVSQAISNKISPWVRPIVEEVFDGQALFDGVGMVFGIPKFSLVKDLVTTVANRLRTSPNVLALQGDLENCGTPGAPLTSITPQGIQVLPGATRDRGVIPSQSSFTVNLQCTDFAGGTLSSVSAAGSLMKKDGGLDMTLWTSVTPLGTPGTYAVECSPLASLTDGEYSLYLSLEGTAPTGQIKQGVVMTVFAGERPPLPLTAINLLLCDDNNCAMTIPPDGSDYVVEISGVKYYPGIKSTDPDVGDKSWNEAQCLANPTNWSTSYKYHAAGLYTWAEHVCSGRGQRLPTVDELLKLYECWQDYLSWDSDIAPHRYMAQGNYSVRLDDGVTVKATTSCASYTYNALCVE